MAFYPAHSCGAKIITTRWPPGVMKKGSQGSKGYRMLRIRGHLYESFYHTHMKQMIIMIAGIGDTKVKCSYIQLFLYCNKLNAMLKC